MPRSSATPLERQVARVRRRLFLQNLLVLLVWAWVGALAVGVAWFLAQPYVLRDAPPWYRWAVLGGAAGVTTLGAVALAVWRAPSPVVAALSLDERFGLKERATTALTLPEREAQTAAAAALRADVNARVGPLRVGDRFPLRLPRSALLVPAAAVVLVLLAFFYNPLVEPPKADASEPLVQSAAAKAEIEKKMRGLQKKAALKKDDRPKSKELERLEGEVDRLAKKPLETREQAREVIKDMAGLEEQLKKRDKQLAQKAEALKEQMQQVERLSKKKDGPAKDLNKALEQGDFQKAKDEAEHLSKKMKEQEEIEKLRKKSQDDKLSEEERKEAKEQLERVKDKALSREQKGQLEQQLKDLKEGLKRLSRNKDEEAQRLREQAARGELDKEQLQRELDQLEKNAAKLDQETLDQLKELADQLGECEKCMKEGKDGEAGQKLKEAAAKLGKLGPDGEAAELAQQLEQLQAARRTICRALDQGGDNPAQAAGRRPESKEGETAAKEERARSRLDTGRLQVIDHVPGDGFKGPRRPAEMREEIRKASQEAPEAIDRQRLPRSASDMARGYFEKLRGPDGGKAAPKP